MTGISRLLVVAAVSVAAFVAALNTFGKAAADACVAKAPIDRSYKVHIQGPVNVDTTRYKLTVSHRGRPVTGARVCLSADMGGSGGMSGMSVDNSGSEVQPGVYEVPVRFIMSGPWHGAVLVRQTGKPAVQLPIELEVA
jgi:hypothetical protein